MCVSIQSIGKGIKSSNHIKIYQFLAIMGSDFPLLYSFSPSCKFGNVDWVLFMDFSTFANKTFTECKPLRAGLFNNLSK